MRNGNLMNAARGPFFMLAAVCALCMAAGAVHAAQPQVSIKAEPESLVAAPGQTVHVQVRMEVPDGYYTYSANLNKKLGFAFAQFKATPKEVWKVNGVVATDQKPTIKHDKNFDADIETFTKQVTFKVPLTVEPGAKPGDYDAVLTFRSQICDATSCVMVNQALKLKLTVKADDADTAEVTPPKTLDPLTDGGDAVPVKVLTERLDARPGETLTVPVRITVPEGWYTYSTAETPEKTRFTEFFLEPKSVGVTQPDAATDVAPKKKFDKNLEFEVEYFTGEVTFQVKVVLARDLKAGEHKATLKLDTQICKDLACVPVRKAFELLVNIAGEALAETAADTTHTAPPTTQSQAELALAAKQNGPVHGTVEDIQKARSEGLWAYLLLSVLMGAGALVTPCVFPMIPITVSFFTKRKQASRMQSLRDAGLYSLGIILTFTLIGLLFAVLFGATSIRAFAANPFVNLAVAAVFVVLALNLFGVFEIPLPTQWLNKLDGEASKGDGIASVLVMAFVFSITSFTCTVPFVGNLLISAAQGEWFYPLLGMAAFATVFSLPFFVLALIPGALKTLPKSGGWLNSVKVVMGFMELAAALKFLSNADLAWQTGVLTYEFFLSLWVALALLTTLYLLGTFKFKHDSDLTHVGGARILFAVLFLGLTFWLGSALFGKGSLGDELTSFVPPNPYPGKEGTVAATDGTAPGNELVWYLDLEEAQQVARAENRPLFVDFTGVNCTNCRYMEKSVFTKTHVNGLLEKFVRVKLITDQWTEASEHNAKLQSERFDSAALPFYVVLSPDDQIVTTFPGMTRNAEEFAAFLKKGLENKPAAAAPPPQPDGKALAGP